MPRKKESEKKKAPKKSSVAKKGSKKPRLILLDVHAILHRAYHALPDFTTRDGKPTGALYGLVTMLLKVIDEFKPDYIMACYDLPEPTYRHEAYEAYKAQRKKTDDGLVEQITESRKVFDAFSIPYYEAPGFEADDLLGTLSAGLKKENVDIIIASGDMDTLQLVDDERVQVYTLRKGIKDTILYDEAAVRDRFGFGPERVADYKGLRGDPSDNIPGVKGIGEKTATTLIKEFGSIEDLYTELEKSTERFEKAGITKRIIELLKDNKEEALFSKMLATIRTDAPITIALPPKQWQEGFDPHAALALFVELEFRALSVRIRSKYLDETPAEATGESKEEEVIDTVELERTLLALWLLDSNLTNPTLADLVDYTREKTFAAAREKVFKELEERELLFVYSEIELPLIPIVKNMQTCGVKIDTDYLNKLSKEYRKELGVLEGKIWKQADMQFNINSPRQLGDVLFDKLELGVKGMKKTSTGARSTREEELRKLTDLHPIIADILEYRELQKLLSTYLEPLPRMVGEDGRLHAHFIQAGTTTGRMASENPNLQNIPIRTDRGERIRRAFIADKGYTLVAFDYSQIELRIAAVLSGDEKLLDIFKSGQDIHRAVAAEVFSVAPEAVTTSQRIKAKTINFGILYGMGVNALRKNLGDTTTRAEAQEFYDEYFKSFPQLTEYLASTKRSAHKEGYTKTYFGRRRYFPDINSKLPHVRAAAERQASNAPIQGTQADIIKMAMARIDTRMQEEGCAKEVKLLLQVHDELVYEVRTDLVEKAAREIKEIMESIVPADETKGIVFLANAASGPNWGERKPLSF